LPVKEESMGRERIFIFWSAGGLASTVFATAVWAQAPVPPTGPAARVVCETGGPIRRGINHVGRTLQDNLIGYPSLFVEPPIGFYNAENFNMMKAKADPHKFTLYRSDFLAGTARFSPQGAARFNLMASRLRGWLGPVLVEWSPDHPGLAEARRTAVLALLQGGGLPVIPERVVIGPSSYPGMLGTDAANNYNILITRDQAAPTQYSHTPASGGSFGAGGGGSP
jgi:hypothetical protein